MIYIINYFNHFVLFNNLFEPVPSTFSLKSFPDFPQFMQQNIPKYSENGKLWKSFN